jgi:hypothetical protein
MKTASRLRVETLVDLLGVKGTANLCYVAGGRRVPRYDQFRSWERRVLLINDYLNHGYALHDLAAKYQLSLPVVKRIVTTYLERKRKADRAAAASSAMASRATP